MGKAGLASIDFRWRSSEGLHKPLEPASPIESLYKGIVCIVDIKVGIAL